jgi:hypothetical protein
MLSQEELSQLIPNEPLPNTQYMVGWYQKDEREIVLVYDKVSRRVVFKSNSKPKIEIDERTGKVSSISRQKQYKHIKHFYGTENCDPPKEVNPEFYKGF